ncbi:conserved hypothetical protein [delta proteobacterium NaphS2]|nr:conserved hypothetical protein [delta proteobacterium NaphS2]
MPSTIRCPRCNAESFNLYGKTTNGKQRYICLVCSRQFVEDSRNDLATTRPLCPICHKKMHVYMREPGFTRFRCSDYPECKGFMKVQR